MPSDLTSRGITLQIEETYDPGAQPKLLYRFTNLAGESWTLARIMGGEPK